MTSNYPLSPYFWVVSRTANGLYLIPNCSTLKGLQSFNNHIAYSIVHGYTPCPNTLGIWHHTTRKTKFCLCVDDFGVKYYSKADAQHLLDSLSENYTHTVDWQGQNFCGLRLEWNYETKLR